MKHFNEIIHLFRRVQVVFLGVETSDSISMPKIVSNIMVKVAVLGVGQQKWFATPVIFENQGRQTLNICSYAQMRHF